MIKELEKNPHWSEGFKNFSGPNNTETQFIDGLCYPFNKWRDQNRDFSPYVILPQQDGFYRIRVYNYDNDCHYVLKQKTGFLDLEKVLENHFDPGTEVVCFSMRHQMENERNHGNFLRKTYEKDPFRLTVKEISNQKDFGYWYKMEGQRGIYNFGYCWIIESVYYNKNK